MKEKLPKDMFIHAWIIVLAAIPSMLDATMINLAIPLIGQAFRTSLVVVQWGITGYILAAVVSTPFVNWLLNRYPGKKILLYSVVGFTLVSLIVGSSWSIVSFIIFRSIQGLIAGLIPPTMSTLLVKTAGKKYLGRIISIVTTPLLLGPILAPSLAGFLLTYLSWRWLFWLNLLVGFLSVVLIYVYLPNYATEADDVKLDLIGLVIIAISSVSGLYWLSQTNSFTAFTQLSTLKYALAFVITLALYVYYDLRCKHKTILPLNLFQSLAFSLKSIAVLVANAIILGALLPLPLYFTSYLHASIHQEALFLASQGMGMIVTRPFIGKWIDRFGAKNVYLIGTIIAVIGTLPFVFFHESVVESWIILCLFIRGLSFGAITIGLTADIYHEVPQNLLPAASVTIQLLENLGTAFGTALFSALLTIHITEVLRYRNIFIVMLLGFILLFFIGLRLPKPTKNYR